jgi:hypothetical protein
VVHEGAESAPSCAEKEWTAHPFLSHDVRLPAGHLLSKGGMPMSWTMEGDYVASCSCDVVCPCPNDGRPTNPKGTGDCSGVAVFHVDQGTLNDVDLSGVTFAFVNYFPSNISAGNWKVGVIVDEAANDAQTDALGRILGGTEGGPFADFAALVGENLGLERSKVALSGASASVGGHGEYSFEPFRGVDGNPTTVKNAAFGFAPEFQIGRATGHHSAFGIDFDSNYGESAHFMYSDAVHEHTRA